MVSLLPRFFDPAEGAVRIDGIDIRELSLKDLRSLIGLVAQDTILFNDTVRNNIAYGNIDCPMEEIEQAARAANAYDFIMAMPSIRIRPSLSFWCIAVGSCSCWELSSYPWRCF